MKDRQKTIDGFRAVADWLEAHPELPEPYISEPLIYFSAGEDAKHDLATVAKALGKAKKEADEHYFNVTGDVGGFSIRGYASRENVCEKVQTGSRVVPARYVPAIAATEAQSIPQHEEPVYEFICPKLLDDEQGQVEQGFVEPNEPAEGLEA